MFILTGNKATALSLSSISRLTLRKSALARNSTPIITRSLFVSRHVGKNKPHEIDRTSMRAVNLRNPRGTLKSLQLSPDLITDATKGKNNIPAEVCTTASTCEKYDLNKALYIIKEHGITPNGFVVASEMVYFKFRTEPDAKSPDVLVLSNGSIVAWGMSEQELLEQLVPLFKDAELRPYKHVETEDMEFVDETTNDPSNSNKSTMVGDLIVLRATSETNRIAQKAAFSSGLARSTKLAALELVLERYISTIKEHSERLASGADLRLSDKEVLRATGQLLQIRGQLNLYSELIETPDLYWSEPELENLYIMVSRQLDISPRIAILNKKLDYASEFVGILKSHTSERTSTRLEWMIIILIMVEVVFETFHTYDRFMASKEETKT